MAISAPEEEWHLFLGGTFDPVHNGHLRSAIEVAEVCGAASVHLMPCHDPVHGKLPGARAQQRVAMLEAAVSGALNEASVELVVDQREILRQGDSFMIDTLQDMRAELGTSRRLGLMMGADSLLSFRQWKAWETIPALTNLVVFHRPGWELSLHHPVFDDLSSLGVRCTKVTDSSQLQAADCEPSGHLFLVETSQVSISSSQIRRLLACGKSVRFLLPDAVLGYIHAHGLYV